MKQLEKYGPWALVTGASAGLGEHFARQLAQAGLNVGLLARRQERLDQLGAELSDAYGVETRSITADLSAPGFLADVIAQTDDLDIGLLVNNAGFTNNGFFLDNDLDDEIRLVDVNCRAAMMLAHCFGRKMRERGSGGIIFSASIAGYNAIPFWANYSASKSYDLLLAEALAAELRPAGVDVMALCPGATATEFADYQGLLAKLAVMQPEPVVSGALNKLGRRRNWVAGVLNNVIVFSMRLVPRRVASAIASFYIRDMVEH